MFGYDAEELWSFELGYQGRLLNDRLQLTLAGFISEYKDKQVELQTNDPGSEGGFVEGILNAGDSDQFGAEFELSWLATDQLTLNFGVGLVDSEWANGTKVIIGGTESDISGKTPRFIQETSVNWT